MHTTVGFYGKLPSHGDFVSRRLPRQFIEPWDEWLQGCIAASRERLGKQWLELFLVSPIWQFGLAPGLCGEQAWAGVMMPSVDKVGRYFPLTLAVSVNPSQLAGLFESSCDWFDVLSELALSSLDYEFDLQAFDERLHGLDLNACFPDADSETAANQFLSGEAKQAFAFELASVTDTAGAFAGLAEQLKQRFLAGSSYWRSAPDSGGKVAFLFCEGLPPAEAYQGFLNGQWPQRGWRFSLSQVAAADCAGNESLEPIPAALEAEIGTETQQIRPLPTRPVDEVVVEPSSNSFGLSVVGLRRHLNEDAILLREDVGLWAVADGMGGHSAGDLASQTLVNALDCLPDDADLESFSEQVAATLQTVNRQLQQIAQQRGSGHIIGSTIVVLLIKQAEFRYLWAGDSRLYRFRNGELEQLTRDHSLYEEAISQGLLPTDGSLEAGRGNVITRAVGADAQLRLDWGQGDIESGDLFLLSSDGLDKELLPADIAGLCQGSPEQITRRLIQEAEARGGRDNISVIAIRPLA